MNSYLDVYGLTTDLYIGAQYYKNFYWRKLRGRAFVPGKPFQSSQMFVGWLGWEGLPGTNALAYYENS